VIGDSPGRAAPAPGVVGIPRVVVAGVGSEFRRDDGAGPAVARLTAEEAPATRDIGPIVNPLDLLGRWDDADLAVVIDAVCSGARPGTVCVVDLTTLSPGPGPTSTHGISLSGVLRLAQAVDQAPARVVVVGIEGDDFGRGMGLSPAVEAAIPVAVRRVVDLIKEVRTCA
jgi:hydrogenase maturation protease